MQSTIASMEAAHARVRLELVEQRERCAHVALGIVGLDLSNARARALGLAMLKSQTGGEEVGRRIKEEWDVYYEVKNELRGIEDDLERLGMSVQRYREVVQV